MKRILIRSDDLGYSEGVNCGIAKAVKDGVIRSVGVMPNMPWVEHGLSLLKGMDVCLGQHTNICVGRPLTDPACIPSLVTETGEFKSSRAYRAADHDIIDLDEVVLEIEAQYARYVELVGKQPSYFECHAIFSDNLSKGLQIVAARHGLPYLGLPYDGTILFRNTKFIVPMEFNDPDYDPVGMLRRYAGRDYAPNECPMIVFHAGYLDEYILTHSSLTRQRPKEVAACCDPELKAWFAEQDVSVVTYDDID